MKMKDSGVEWIGEIPEEWEIKKISQLFTHRNEKVSDLHYKALSVTKVGIVPQLDSSAKSLDHNNRKLVKVNDFVINSRSDRKLSSGISMLEGSVSVINTVMSFDHNLLFPTYVNYLLKNYGFAEEFFRWGTGIVLDLWSTNWERSKKIQLPYPNFETQIKIAHFLDDKVSKIDAIIADTKESIEALKAYKQSVITETVTKGLNPDAPMKDSGVEWIGEVPEEWELSKIKFHATIDPSFDIKVPDELKVTFAPMDKLKNGFLVVDKIDLIGNLKGKYTYFFEDDIIIAKVRPSFENGNIAIASGLENKIGFGSSEIYTIRNRNKHLMSNRYLFYYLRNSKFINHASSSMTGVAGLKRVSSQVISNLYIPNISFELGERIADFLDNMTGSIENLIQEKEQLITEYESYKKSLIYEYVTGKKRVGGEESAG